MPAYHAVRQPGAIPANRADAGNNGERSGDSCLLPLLLAPPWTGGAGWCWGLTGLAGVIGVLGSTEMNIALPSAQRALHFIIPDRPSVGAAYPPPSAHPVRPRAHLPACPAASA